MHVQNKGDTGGIGDVQPGGGENLGITKNPQQELAEALDLTTEGMNEDMTAWMTSIGDGKNLTEARDAIPSSVLPKTGTDALGSTPQQELEEALGLTTEGMNEDMTEWMTSIGDGKSLTEARDAIPSSVLPKTGTDALGTPKTDSSSTPISTPTPTSTPSWCAKAKSRLANLAGNALSHLSRPSGPDKPKIDVLQEKKDAAEKRVNELKGFIANTESSLKNITDRLKDPQTQAAFKMGYEATITRHENAIKADQKDLKAAESTLKNVEKEMSRLNNYENAKIIMATPIVYIRNLFK